MNADASQEWIARRDWTRHPGVVVAVRWAPVDFRHTWWREPEREIEIATHLGEVSRRPDHAIVLLYYRDPEREISLFAESPRYERWLVYHDGLVGRIGHMISDDCKVELRPRGWIDEAYLH